MGIVERLRENQCPENMGCNPLCEFCQCGTMDEAADLIERLREALGDAARGFDEANIPIAKLTGSRSIMVDTFAARARAALKEIEGD